MKTGERLILVRDIPITQESCIWRKASVIPIRRMKSLSLIAQDLKVRTHTEFKNFPISIIDIDTAFLNGSCMNSTFYMG